MTKQWGVLAMTLGLALCAAGSARADDQTKPDDTNPNTTIHDQSTLPQDQKTGDVDNDTDVQRQRGVDQTTPADTDSKSMSIQSLKPDQVKQLQQKLTDKGFYQGKIDGHAGPLTLAAFHQFQKDQGVAISDKLDFQSASALGITLDENEMKPVRGVDESGSSGTDVNGTKNPSGTDTGTTSQSGTDTSTGTTQNQSGTDTSTGTVNQSGTDTSTGTVDQGSTDIQNQSGTDMQKNKCKDLSSPDAVNCTDGTKNQSGTSGTSSSTDIQNQSGTSTSTPNNGSTGYGAGSSATGNSTYGGVNTDTSTGVQNQSGRDVTSVSDPATIKNAKQALKDKHFYNGKINEKNDGKFQASLRDFQKKNHLAITGTLDQPTLAALGIQAGTTNNGTMNDGTMNNGSGTMDNGTNGTNPTSTPAPAATGTPSSNPY